MNEMPAPQTPIPDRPSGLVPRERLQALARRVGPSLDAMGRHPGLVGALVLVLGLAATLLLFLGVIDSIVHTRKEVLVPDLTGKTLDQALDLIAVADLSLAKEAVEFDDAFPPGAVIKQAPLPGLKVREGKVIRVTLSSGGEVVFAPEATDRPLPEAQNLLRGAGLVLGALSEMHSQRHEAGWVMEQTPAAGTVMKKGQMVDLRVSKGPPPEGTTLMPEFVNQPLTRAMEWVREKGLKAEVTEEVQAEAVPGLVIDQAPPPDTLVSQTVPVEFTVSRSTMTAANTRTVRYDVPAGSDRVQVRVVVRDERGAREVFQGYQDAGTLVEVPVVVRGATRARIFVNGVLIEEKLVE